MRDALPNASFIGFTGTPIALEDRDTRGVFGDYVSIYDIQDAVDDKATVPIYYESRLAKLDINREEIDELNQDVEEVIEDEEDVAARENTKSRWAAAREAGRRRAADQGSAPHDLVRSLRDARNPARPDRRQGDVRGDEPRYLRSSIRRNHQAAAGMGGTKLPKDGRSRLEPGGRRGPRDHDRQRHRSRGSAGRTFTPKRRRSDWRSGSRIRTIR